MDLVRQVVHECAPWLPEEPWFPPLEYGINDLLLKGPV